MKRHIELDGNYYELMTPAAEELSEKHPNLRRGHGRKSGFWGLLPTP
jgi:hypothetical protein